MANRELITTIQIRRGTTNEWINGNANKLEENGGKPLAEGEIGIEFYSLEGNTKTKFKIGDGETIWDALEYKESLPYIIYGQGGNEMSDEMIGQIHVDTASGKVKIYIPQLEGATEPASWQNVMVLKENDKIDIGLLPTGTVANKIPILGAGGKLNQSVIPAMAITNTHVVLNESAMLALVVGDAPENIQEGDIAILTTENLTYIFKGGSNTIANWAKILTPLDAVGSVAGLTGVISASALIEALELNKVENYEIATESEATEGASNKKYMTPLRTKQAINVHATETSNPHSVTKTQVGLSKLNNYDTPTDAEAKAGTVSNKYATPKTIGDYATENLVPKTRTVAGKALSTNITLGTTNLTDGADILMSTDTYIIDGGEA